MDVSFAILLPNNIDINVLNWKEVYIEWGEEKYSQDPQIYKWNDLVLFEFDKNIQSYERLLGKHVCLNSYSAYVLKGSEISDFEWCINKHIDTTNNPIHLLFNDFLSQIDYWAALTLVDCDKFDEVYSIDNNTDALSILKESLDWSNPKGIALIKNDKS
ncbi:hypothetical protein [Pectobacterium parmentieri]|uniref:hypothetical protein n=1 Tax=Pectobacterium parmentieri TaxID=1905730 RepID=UPI000473698C|nr:hypothetical protein [Pectobacterium parmentieri]AYH07731.1 hypothetical protein C5E25_21540 [Pectobacterium parmentieri]PWD57027.1 hypothetical protein DF211_21630 [Pectobacterium parmentieri]